MNIGIVITAYNSEGNLPRAVAALRQTQAHISVIVIDDHSARDVFGLLQEFHRLANFKFLRLDRNVGPADARNFGILLSRECDALTFHDHDDLPLPDKLEKQCAALRQTKEIDELRRATIAAHLSLETEIVVSRVVRRERDGTEQIAGAMIYLLRDLYPNAYGDFGASGRKYSLHTVSSLFRKTIFRRLGGFYPALYHYEDNELAARFIAAGANFNFLPDALYEFNKTDDSLTYQRTEKDDAPLVEIFRRIARMRTDTPRMSPAEFVAAYRVKINSPARVEFAYNFDKSDCDDAIPADEDFRRELFAALGRR